MDCLAGHDPGDLEDAYNAANEVTIYNDVTYEGYPFLAVSAEENSKGLEKEKLQKERARNICRVLGHKDVVASQYEWTTMEGWVATVLKGKLRNVEIKVKSHKGTGYFNALFTSLSCRGKSKPGESPGVKLGSRRATEAHSPENVVPSPTLVAPSDSGAAPSSSRSAD